MSEPDDYCELCDLPRSQCIHGQPPPEPVKKAVKKAAARKPAAKKAVGKKPAAKKAAAKKPAAKKPAAKKAAAKKPAGRKVAKKAKPVTMPAIPAPVM